MPIVEFEQVNIDWELHEFMNLIIFDIVKEIRLKENKH